MSATKAKSVDGWARFTDLAFALCVGIVLARALMLETIRDAFGVYPGQELILRSPIAGTSVVLDLLMYLPALAVGLRCVFDDRWRSRRSLAVWALGTLGALAVGSIFWSADRFAAGVSASKLLAGAAVLWTAIQWVRDWGRMRALAAILAGLLGVYLVHSLIYVYVDLPEMRQNWEQNREMALRNHGFEPGSVAANQFEKKIYAGELIAFGASPNTLAAITVMIMVVLLGDLGQRWRDRAPLGSYVPAMALLAGGVWILMGTGSKTAGGTLAMALVLLVAGWKLRGWMGRHRRVGFAGGVGAFCLGWAAIIAHGIYHGTLFQTSLTFRWHYWVSSARMFAEHWLLGVGWENFGAYYTQFRLPIAPEEIRDPHNLFVRFATELGVAGLLLGLGWIGSIIWEATAPSEQEDLVVPASEQIGIKWLILAAACGVAVASLSGVDLTQEFGVVEFEIVRRVGYGVVLLMVSTLLCADGFGQLRMRQAAAPLLLLGLGVGLAMFLVQCMVDFAMAETGAFYLFLVTAGAAIGMRLSLRPWPAGRPALVLAIFTVAMLSTGIVIVAPVVLGEGTARAGDEALAGKNFALARDEYQIAFDNSAWLRNADYLARKCAVQAWAGEPAARQQQTLAQAIEANPRNARLRAMAGHVAVEAGDLSAAKKAYAAATSLDPCDVHLHLEAAEGFEKLGDIAEAKREYAVAIERNSQLPEAEIKRLPEAKLEELKSHIKALNSTIVPGAK